MVWQFADTHLKMDNFLAYAIHPYYIFIGKFLKLT